MLTDADRFTHYRRHARARTVDKGKPDRIRLHHHHHQPKGEGAMIPMTPDDIEDIEDAAYAKPRANMDEGGISEPGWFNIGVLFQSFEAALAAEEEFRAHGYVFEIRDVIDDYSDATFVTVSRRAGTATCDELFDQAFELAERLDGDADGAWIVEERVTGKRQ